MEADMPSLSMESPVGTLTIEEEDETIVAIRWGNGSAGNGSKLLTEAARQLSLYFDGRLKRFDLPLGVAGTAFDQRVRAAMRAIPYGETRTYGELAHAADSGPRAI